MIKTYFRGCALICGLRVQAITHFLYSFCNHSFTHSKDSVSKHCSTYSRLSGVLGSGGTELNPGGLVRMTFMKDDRSTAVVPRRPVPRVLAGSWV